MSDCRLVSRNAAQTLFGKGRASRMLLLAAKAMAGIIFCLDLREIRQEKIMAMAFGLTFLQSLLSAKFDDRTSGAKLTAAYRSVTLSAHNSKLNSLLRQLI